MRFSPQSCGTWHQPQTRHPESRMEHFRVSRSGSSKFRELSPDTVSIYNCRFRARQRAPTGIFHVDGSGATR